MFPRHAIAQLGGQPVVYGDDALWDQLTPALRPYFQSAGAQSQWRAEQEWRLIGDLRVDAIDEFEVIAPTKAAAHALRDDGWPARALAE